MAHSRSTIMKRLRAKVEAGLPIIGAGAGTGISAKCEEAGGVDLIVVYNSGRFRMAGCGSLAGLLPYGSANQIVKEMAPEILCAVKRTPILAGVCGTDPFLLRAHFLGELRDLGYSGIQNFPTVGLIDGQFRKNLEETGIRFDLEIDCVAEAHAMDLLTTPYVFDSDQARRMTDAGADLLIAHMGLTTSGTVGAATAKTRSQCVEEIRRIADVAKARRPDVLVLCHGGPLATTEDVQYVLDRCPEVVGFYGASAMERLPTEVAITEQVRSFAKVTLARTQRKGPPRVAPTDLESTPSSPDGDLHVTTVD